MLELRCKNAPRPADSRGCRFAWRKELWATYRDQFRERIVSEVAPTTGVSSREYNCGAESTAAGAEPDSHRRRFPMNWPNNGVARALERINGSALPLRYLLLLTSLVHSSPAQGVLQYLGTADSTELPVAQEVGIAVPAGASFKYFGVVLDRPSELNFVVVSPSSGVAPAFSWIGMNPSIVPYLSPGGYGLVVNFGVAGFVPHHAR